MSYADANHVKLIQAHEMAKVANAKPTIPAATWSAVSACESS